MKRFTSLLLLLFFVLATYATDTLRVACVGNSITYGHGIPNREQCSYPAVLGRLLGSGYEVRNFGISARTLLMKGDRPYMNEPIYQEALAFNPDIVTIKLGTNDTKPFNWQYGGEFKDDLRTLIRSFQALDSHPRIILCTPIPGGREDWGINDSTLVASVIPYIREVADELSLEVVDLHTAFTPYQHLLYDRVHPNADGAAVIAHVLAGAIRDGQQPPVCKPHGRAWRKSHKAKHPRR